VARRFDIEIGGRVTRVVVERVGGRYRIERDGRTEWADAVPVDERTLSLVIDGDRRESHEVGFLEARERGELEIYLRTGVIHARIDGRAPQGGTGGGETRPAARGGPARVTTPMPGRVVRVLVVAGDSVLARQGLVVVEAMKMQNELRAPRDGVVAEIPVREGMTVEAGRVVAVLE